MSTGAEESALTAEDAMDWDLDDLTLPDDDDESDAAAPDEDESASATAESAEDDSEDPPPTTDAPDDDPASAEQATAHAAPDKAPSPDATAEPVVPEGFTPPKGGTPFTFSLDGQEVAVEGITQHGDHLVIPKEIWDRQLMPKYLGNRGAWQDQVKQWRGRESEYQHQLAQEQARQSEAEQRAQALLGKIAELDQGGAEAWAQWLDNFSVNRPALEAEVRASLAERRAQALESQQQRERQQADQESLVPIAQNYLGETLKQYLAQDAFKVLGPDAEALHRELWEDHKDRLFFTADRDYPDAGLAKGQLGFNFDALSQLLARRAEYAQKAAEKIAKIEADAKANARALAKHRKPATKPKPQASAKVTAPAEDWRDAIESEDWLAD